MRMRNMWSCTRMRMLRIKMRMMWNWSKMRMMRDRTRMRMWMLKT